MKNLKNLTYEKRGSLFPQKTMKKNIKKEGRFSPQKP
jgi:hypothetical protein